MWCVEHKQQFFSLRLLLLLRTLYKDDGYLSKQLGIPLNLTKQVELVKNL